MVSNAADVTRRARKAMSVRRRRDGAIAEINVTPMADVMIVLLIIFMVATPIIVQAPVRLPGAVYGAEQTGEHLEIVVRSDGEITLGGAAIPGADALVEYLEARHALSAEQTSVLIQADRDSTYSDVARVLAACRRAGVTSVALAASREIR